MSTGDQLDTEGKKRQMARLTTAVKTMGDLDTVYIPSPHDGVIVVGSVFRNRGRYQAFAGIGDRGTWLGEFSSPTNALAVVQAWAPPGDPRISLEPEVGARLQELGFCR